MPIPFLIAAAAVEGVIKIVQAEKQKKEEKQMEAQNTRPVETVPQSVLDATAISKLMASLGMPAPQYAAATRDINRNTTNTLAAARDRRAGVDTIGATNQQANDAKLNLEATNAEMQQKNLANYVQQLGNQGQWENQIWQFNNAQKFQENAAAIRALKTASQANTNSALSGLLATAVTLSGTKGTGTGETTNTTQTQQATPTDPTITDPSQFDQGTPQALYKYLNSIQLN